MLHARFFLPILKTDIGLCSQLQKLGFFPNFMKKVPNSKKNNNCDSDPLSNK